MKRSKALSLLLMGSLTVSAAGCGADRADEETYTFTSLDECYSSAIFSESECRDLARSALAETPRFSSREECEAQFGEGACQGQAPKTAEGASGGSAVQQHSGGMWMPMMMGFMAGRFLGGGGMMQGSQGLYRDPAANPQQGRSFRTAGGETVSPGAGGRVSNPTPRMTQSMSHSAKPVSGRSSLGARGGFSGGSSFGGGAS